MLLLRFFFFNNFKKSTKNTRYFSRNNIYDNFFPCFYYRILPSDIGGSNKAFRNVFIDSFPVISDAEGKRLLQKPDK